MNTVVLLVFNSAKYRITERDPMRRVLGHRPGNFYVGKT